MALSLPSLNLSCFEELGVQAPMQQANFTFFIFFSISFSTMTFFNDLFLCYLDIKDSIFVTKFNSGQDSFYLEKM